MSKVLVDIKLELIANHWEDKSVKGDLHWAS